MVFFFPRENTMFNPNPTEWAQMIFGQANLGDPRRTKRLVQLTSDMASNASSSIVKACGSSDKIEGAYHFIRNENISPKTWLMQASNILMILCSKDPWY